MRPAIPRLAEPKRLPPAVDAAALLDELTQLIARHLIAPAPARHALALWIAHTWALEAADISPRVAFLSPRPHAGKTTALRLLARLVPRPLMAVHSRAHALSRMIDVLRPTLLLDDADRWALRNHVLRATLAAGAAREARVLRTTRSPFELPALSCFAPCALALTGALQDDIAKRSIAITLQRALPDEAVSPLDGKAASETFARVRAQLARFAHDHAPKLRAATPGAPSQLDAETTHVWHPLFAIAEEAGGAWPARAHAAALALVQESARSSADIQLLEDIRGAFGAADRITTEDLLAALTRNPERPWKRLTYRRPLDALALAKLLAPFGIRPRTIRIPNQGLARGYMAPDFAPVFARYLRPAEVEPLSNMLEGL